MLLITPLSEKKKKKAFNQILDCFNWQ